MRKKIFGLLLGATFMFTLIAGVGVFNSFDANAEEPGGGAVVQEYLLGQSWFPLEYSWCDLPGNNCLATASTN